MASGVVRLEESIGIIVGAQEGNINYIPMSKAIGPITVKYPVIWVDAQTTAVEEQRLRRMAVTITAEILPPERELDDTDITIDAKISKLQTHWSSVIETYIRYLTRSKYKFCYSIEGDIRFDYDRDFGDEGTVIIAGILELVENMAPANCNCKFDETKFK